MAGLLITCRVMSGDYKGEMVWKGKRRGFQVKQKTFCFSRKVYINRKAVASCELVSSQSQKSASSGIAKGIVGGMAFGAVGALAGASSGKTKSRYVATITFNDGTRCLCEMDDIGYERLNMALL